MRLVARAPVLITFRVDMKEGVLCFMRFNVAPCAMVAAKSRTRGFPLATGCVAGADKGGPPESSLGSGSRIVLRAGGSRY